MLSPEADTRYVSDSCERFLADFINGHEAYISGHPHHRLHILVSRGKKLLKAPKRNVTVTAGFGLAVLGNLVSRAFLQTLTRGKLPDRNDFLYYGENNDFRIPFSTGSSPSARVRDCGTNWQSLSRTRMRRAYSPSDRLRRYGRIAG